MGLPSGSLVYRFAVLLLLLILTTSTVYGNVVSKMAYVVYQLPTNCWDDYR